MSTFVIGNDGKPVNQAYDQQRDGENLHVMYLRERPLLDKIRQMRLANEKLEKQMKNVLEENA
jgi:hypothetical protein